MKVYHSLQEFDTLGCAVATTGTFDGVHLGHQKILNQLIEKAKEVGGESVLLTFYPHPRRILHPDLDLKLIHTLEEKIEKLRHTGLDHLIIHPFSKAFSRTTSLEFVREILVNTIGVKHLVIGYDHHFGRNREGSFEHLREFGPIYGFDVEEISALDVDQINVSSTKIRAALESGDVQLAQEYLGAAYSVEGTVVEGDRIGRTLGFPTANLQLTTDEKLLPKDGVYAGWSAFNGRRYRAMANIGARPTVDSANRTIEVHLLDFEGDLYGQHLRFEFSSYIRDIQKFDSLEQLKAQLQKDRVKSLEALA